ncbi:transposase [Bacillus thuringiensis]|uniref:transposase n=1 Tax=Bacillus thuringiensis TaxID=1428 RepID=UPI003AFF9D0E
MKMRHIFEITKHYMLLGFFVGSKSKFLHMSAMSVSHYLVRLTRKMVGCIAWKLFFCNATHFQYFLQYVLDENPNTYIVMVLDNARIHHAKLLKSFYHHILRIRNKNVSSFFS